MSANSTEVGWVPKCLEFRKIYYKHVIQRVRKERDDLQPYVEKAHECDWIIESTIRLYIDILHSEHIQLYGAWTVVDEGLGGGAPEPECNSVWRSKTDASAAARRECTDNDERKVMSKECEQAIDVAAVDPELLYDMVAREIQYNPNDE